MQSHSNPPPIRAYSYIRFSSRAQAAGHGLQRQTDLAEAFCKRRGWTLDETLSLRDLGVSAFRGKNALVGNLGVFLAAVKRGTVPAGSALIVESVDRISRQGIDEGYDIIKGILKAGILLVTLSPEREFDVSATKSLTRGALEIQLILERAAEESETKSKRGKAARAAGRKRARAGGVILTRRLPGWIEEVGGRLRLISERAAAVRRIYHLAASGHGVPGIIKTLKAEKIPPFGEHVVREHRVRSAYSGEWTRPYVRLILSDRRSLGELQMYQGTDANGRPIPDGEPVAGYYPAAITEDEWKAARAGIRERRKNPGRVSESHVNIFAGLLKHARDGDSYVMTQRISQSRSAKAKGQPGRKFQILVNALGDSAQARAYSLPYDVLERAVCSLLREIDPHEILNGDRPPDETAALAAELADVEAELAEATAYMDANGFSPAIAKRVTTLEANQREVAARLLEARETAVYPLSESWGEVQGLLGALDEAPDPREARLRLRSALRRIAESAWVLIVPRGQERLTAVQFWFTGGRCRSYLILSRPAAGPRPAGCRAGSCADVAELGDLDLRKRSDAAKLEAALAVIDLAVLGDALDEVRGG
jgi:DNA invertase Pin-like site-specific DNA recombinase